MSMNNFNPEGNGNLSGQEDVFQINADVSRDYQTERQLKMVLSEAEDLIDQLNFIEAATQIRLNANAEEWRSRLMALVNTDTVHLNADSLTKLLEQAKGELQAFTRQVKKLPSGVMVRIPPTDRQWQGETKSVVTKVAEEIPDTRVDFNEESKEVTVSDWSENKEKTELMGVIEEMQDVYRDWVKLEQIIGTSQDLLAKTKVEVDDKEQRQWNYYSNLFRYNMLKHSPEMRAALISMSHDYDAHDNSRLETYKNIVRYYRSIHESLESVLISLPIISENETQSN